MRKNAEDCTTLAETKLRASTLRMTYARRQVLCALLEAQHALSHQDVQNMLPDIDRVTLYRVLDNLTDAGLAHKISGDDRVFRYSVGNEGATHGSHTHTHGHQHGHFKCTRCARIFCLEDINEKLFATNMAPHEETLAPALTLPQQLQEILHTTLGEDFQSHEIELTIKGLCDTCAEQDT